MRFLSLRHTGWYARRMLSRIGKRLHLDDSQNQMLVSMYDTMHGMHTDIQQQKQTNHADIEALLQADNLDRLQLLHLIQAPVKVLETRLTGMADRFAELFDSMDTGQRKRLLQLWHQRRHRCCHTIHA